MAKIPRENKNKKVRGNQGTHEKRNNKIWKVVVGLAADPAGEPRRRRGPATLTYAPTPTGIRQTVKTVLMLRGVELAAATLRTEEDAGRL